MLISSCSHCGHEAQWQWEDAFNKFGFGDGLHPYLTDQVVHYLSNLGYNIEIDDLGMHNTLITSIKKNDVELIPENSSAVCIGYTCPREYLPPGIVSDLDGEYPRPNDPD